MTRKEILDCDMEQGHMVQILLKHCHEMKRQETRLRMFTGLLLTAFLTILVWKEFKENKDAFPGTKMEALRADRGPPKRFSAHLQPSAQSMIDACPKQQNGEQLIQWRQMGDGLHAQKFNLTDSSVLHVLTKGLYLINLRLSYRMGGNLCQGVDIPVLGVQVTQQHSNYKKERDVISAVESMPCKLYWRQSVTLNKVITLEADTALRVKIDSKTCKYVDWTKNSHLEVTYL